MQKTMKLCTNIFLFLSILFYSELHAQCNTTINTTTDAFCNGICDGSATVNATGGSNPYTYQWDAATGNQTSAIATGLCAGVYSVTSTDANGCTSTVTTTITEPTVISAVFTNMTPISCNGSCNGSLTAVATGGTPPYSYIWSTGSTTPTELGLCAGIYWLSITDANGCTTSIVDSISPAIPITFDIAHTNSSCFGHADGTATIGNITGSSAPYTYQWSNGMTSSSIGNLFAGIYTVTLVDNNGCSVVNSVTIADTLCAVTLYGIVKQDSNSNCIPDSIEAAMPGQFIKVTNTTTGYVGYLSTNNSGEYEGRLDLGTYTLELIPPFGPYWNPCQGLQTVTISSSNSIDTVNWVLQSMFDCPLLTVDISAPFIRPTGGGSNYTVHYCNHGTILENNPYVEVTIDSFLNVLGSSIPITSQTGNLFRFDLDTLDPGECGSFHINVIADPAVTPGQTHCSKAHIYPDSICLPSWNGAILNTDGTCLNDTILFEISNTGNAMANNANYTIFEDDVIIHMTPFILSDGSSMMVKQPVTPGKTYRLEVPQETGFPDVLGASIAYTAIEGCLPFFLGGFNTGFITQYYTGNTSPFISIDCQPNITSYDPNDKSAQPKGYGSQHYITANTPLEYRVRFQNTGTDTAFNIVIVDTLSSHVDPTSLQMGASNHPYTWALSGTGILTVNFDNILLVDSNTNEPLSHGFFSYTIDQQPNLSHGTVINNQAAIYFDYNPPIFTNTTFHTIGENFIPIVLTMKEAWIEQMQVHIYPNPTSGLIYIDQLQGNDIDIEVFDNLGRSVLQTNTNDKQTALDLNKLTNGIYYVHIRQEQRISTHKVIKH